MLAHRESVDACLHLLFEDVVFGRFHPNDRYQLEMCGRWFHARLRQVAPSIDPKESVLLVCIILRDGLAVVGDKAAIYGDCMKNLAGKQLQSNHSTVILRAVPLVDELLHTAGAIGGELESFIWESCFSVALESMINPLQPEHFSRALAYLDMGGGVFHMGGLSTRVIQRLV